MAAGDMDEVVEVSLTVRQLCALLSAARAHETWLSSRSPKALRENLERRSLLHEAAELLSLRLDR